MKSKLPTPLRGIAIGNGWIDGRRQYPAYLDYAVKHGLIEENSDVSDTLFHICCGIKICYQFYKESKKVTDQCLVQLDKITGPEPVKDDFCESVLGTVMTSRDKK